MNIELILSITGALAAAFKWIYEYSRKLKWEMNVFLLEQIEKFRGLESTKAMEKMLDWNAIYISLQDERILVNDLMLIGAFKTHDIKHTFTGDEAKLRNVFDEYFDNLTKFIFMAQAGLVDKKNLVLFLEYWFKILSGISKSKSHEVLNEMWKYMNFYGYVDLIQFIEEYKNSIKIKNKK
jgi:hypothetical protein